MNVVLIGYRGSGKTTVGRALAERLGWPLVDTDNLIEKRAGLSIREIYAQHGEQVFRDLESEVVTEVARLRERLISTGGGVVLRPQNVQALRESGKLVYLTAPADVLWARIYGDAQRHLTRLKMDPQTGLQQVRQSLVERGPIYTQSCDLMVRTEDRSITGIAEEILAALRLVRS